MSLEPTQVVELIVDRGHGATVGYGSGYQISPELILTAGHVVADAQEVEIRFSTAQPRPVSALSRPIWRGVNADLAVLELTTPNPTNQTTRIPDLGDLPALATPFVPFRAVGFPAHKAVHQQGIRTIRDTDDLTGEIPTLANAKTARLDLRISHQHLRSATDWRGFSGAPVFAHDRLIGVVVESESGALSGVRLASVLERHPAPYARDQEPAVNVAKLSALLEQHGLRLQFVPARRRPNYTVTIQWPGSACHSFE